MSRQFKTKGKKTLKKLVKLDRRKKRIAKSTRKRNIKSRKKRNTVNKRRQTRKLLKGGEEPIPKHGHNMINLRSTPARSALRPVRRFERRVKMPYQTKKGKLGYMYTKPKKQKTNKKGGVPRRDNFLKAYMWESDGNVMKGFVNNIEGGYVYVKTQMGDDGPFEVLTFEPREFLALEKLEQLGSDDTKNLKRKARQEMEDAFIDSDDENDNDNLERSDDGTASTRGTGDDDTISSTESLTESQIEAWNRQGAEASNFPIDSDDENDNDNLDNISVGTASTRGFLEDLDLGSDIETED